MGYYEECSKKHLRNQFKPYSIFNKKPMVTMEIFTLFPTLSHLNN